MKREHWLYLAAAAFGAAVWILDPGRYQLPDIAGKPAGGAEYMVMWTAVLAGDDGMGRDFDMVRASSAYSSGAHDEWNIFVRINRKRPLGDQVAIFFDSRSASPAEMEVDVSPGYELR